MRKIIAGLMVTAAMLSFGCGGRNSDFGTVDIKKVQAEATVIKTVQEDLKKQMETMDAEMKKAMEEIFMT